METAKAAVELPSPFAGTVVALHAADGDVVDVGTPIITIRTGAAAPDPVQPASDPVLDGAEQDPPARAQDRDVDAPPATTTEPEPPDAAPDQGGRPQGDEEPRRTAVLVGYGVRVRSATRRPRRVAARPVVGAPPGPGPGETVAP